MKGGKAFLFAFAAFALGGCAVNTIYQSPSAIAADVSKREPKRAITAAIEEITIYNETGYNLSINDGEYYAMTGQSTLAVSDWFTSDDDTITFSRVDESYYLSLQTNSTAFDLPRPSFTLSLSWLDEGNDYLYFTAETSAGEITIHNEKPTGSGPITIFDEDLETLAIAQPGYTATFDRAYLLSSTCTMTTDSVLCNIGSTSGGSDLAADVYNYTLDWETPADVYVSSDTPYFSIVNETPWDMWYYHQALTDIDETDSSYSISAYGTTLDYDLEAVITIVSLYPFEVQENDEAAQIATWLDTSTADIWYDLEGYYAVTFPATSTLEDAIFTISGTDGQATDVLYGTFQTIANAFAALLPLLEINIFGTMTIGAILLIPFTYYLMKLLIGLIKK